MKRTFSQFSGFNPSPFLCTPTSLRNYCVSDTLSDWASMYKTPKRNSNGSTVENGNFLSKRGISFETNIVNRVIQKFPNMTFRKISEVITPESCKSTIEAIKAGVDIIHSAPFESPKRNLRGIIDLLIRADKIHQFGDNLPLVTFTHDFCNTKISTFLYYVVDIKFSTLNLCSGGMYLRNTGNYPAYKTQLACYTDVIGDIQGVNMNLAFLLGRRWKYTHRRICHSGSNESFEKLGVVDFKGNDSKYTQIMKDAIQWRRDLTIRGAEWKEPTLSQSGKKVIGDSRLFPNVTTRSVIDPEMDTYKSTLAESISDITQIWYCGEKQRQYASTLGIATWRDPKCTSKTLGVNGVRANVIDKILEINRQSVDTVRPKRITTDLFSWRDETVEEAFVDFETFLDIFHDHEQSSMIFMIGVYHKGTYTCFTAKSNKKIHEEEIIREFMKFVSDKGIKKLWYFYAEQFLWRKAISTLNWVVEPDGLVWCDLYKIFIAEPIVIHGCYKFGLKEISAGLYRHGLIDANLEDAKSDCKNGFDAGVRAWKGYTCGENLNTILCDISRYNEFDVKVLRDILRFFRTR